ncbi:P-loop containing nucleoside triphosphate hydrolase protein [Cladochytrium replicatum]|nr:P-loop containing nucleoside triphosphate hydrolase protein [Cladochytrium replicatum]
MATSTSPWIEKYRPKQLSDVAAQAEAVAVLKRSLESQDLPHLLFYGPPGTGKTSTILALARELYGPENMRGRVLELNASDERGIDIVREKVKTFAKTTLSRGQGPPYKIIILDEADSMTVDAQTALRRTMETYSKITRFCLICNYISRIIEPLTSRCAKFRFKPLDDGAVMAKLQYICDQEGVLIEPAALSALSKVSGGDLRKSTMFLQSAARLFHPDPITSVGIGEIAGIVPDATIDVLLSACQSQNFSNLESVAREVVKSGYSASQIVLQLNDKVIANQIINQRTKALITQVVGAVDKSLNDGADEHLQLLKVLASIAGLLAKAA